MSGNNLVIHIEKPGLYTTLQDLGRPGHEDKGIPAGGALDRHAAQRTNKLLQNPESTPVMEITLVGPEIRFEGKGNIAICGANLEPKLNNQPVRNEHVIQINTGDRLTFGKALTGCRAYLGVAGKWQVRKWLNSVTPVSSFPDFTPDSWCKKDQRITVETNLLSHSRQNAESTPENLHEVRVFKGPEFYRFKPKDQSRLFGLHQLSNDCNRVGYRLKTRITVPDLELISSGVFPGVIQVTHEGQLIVLMRDGQTTGGYPRIGVVHEENLNILAQLKPGDGIDFIPA